MKYGKLNILTFVFVLLTSSCATQKYYITLDILRPAQVEFKADAGSLLVVNNTTRQPDSIGHQITFYNGLKSRLSIPLDSADYFYLSVLAEEIKNRQFFSSVQLLNESITENTDFDKIIPLQYKTASELGKEHGADVIISLDRFFINTGLSEFYWERPGGFSMYLEARYDAMWSVHYPNLINVAPLFFRDTLFWESDLYWGRDDFEEMPDVRNLLLDGVFMVGSNAVNRFIPYWSEVDRYFYNLNGKYMKEAMDKVYIQDWEAAILLWEKAMTENNRKKVKSYSANNIAIIYEILGDYDKAIEYMEHAVYFLGLSFDLSPNKYTLFFNYKEELRQIKEDVLKLNKQLGK